MYREAKEFESKNAYIDRLLKANESIFKEVMNMNVDTSLPLDQFIIAIAEKRGLLDDRYRKEREEEAREIARSFKQDNIPVHIIVKNTGLTLQEVEAL